AEVRLWSTHSGTVPTGVCAVVAAAGGTFRKFLADGCALDIDGQFTSLSKLYRLDRNPRWRASPHSSNRPAGRSHLLCRLFPDLCPKHDLRRSGKAFLFSPGASCLVPDPA